jgi:hypothetical protein
MAQPRGSVRLMPGVMCVHATVHFPSIDCHLALAEVYDKVDIVVE